MQVDVCKAALREILALQAEAKAYAGALEGLSQSYQASLGDTKFAEQIEQRKQLIEQQNPCGTPPFCALLLSFFHSTCSACTLCSFYHVSTELSLLCEAVLRAGTCPLRPWTRVQLPPLASAHQLCHVALVSPGLRRYSAMRDPVYTAFVRDLEARNGDGAVSAGDEDEDVAVVNTQGQVAKNAKCPITGRPVRCHPSGGFGDDVCRDFDPLACHCSWPLGSSRPMSMPCVWEARATASQQ